MLSKLSSETLRIW